MEKFSLFVKRILALLISGGFWYFLSNLAFIDRRFEYLLLAAFAFLLFGYLDFRITGTKPRFLFELNQADTYLNKKGGFWNLFKWIVILLGLAYDLVAWSLWGVNLLFLLVAELLLLVKTIFFGIIDAFTWFLRQLFPPFVFLYRMFMHYVVQWGWWIYQLAARNVRTSMNRNFYFIALMGTVPAIFIVFLFYVISQLAGMPGLVLFSYVFAIMPLTWSFGEIAALRFEGREKDDFSSVRDRFRIGFDSMRSVLFYMVLLLALIALELLLNLLGWIPNLSMSLLGIVLNLNMGISLLIIFLLIIMAYIPGIMPAHILYRQEHQNDFRSSLVVLGMLGRKFLRYTFVEIPAILFGALMLIIPAALLVLTFLMTDTIKDTILEYRVEQLEARSGSETTMEASATRDRVERLELYQDVPLLAPGTIVEMMDGNRIAALEQRVSATKQRIAVLEEKIAIDMEALSPGDEITLAQEEDRLAIMEADLQELKRRRAQMPVLYLFIGIMFSVFGGLVLAVYIAYIGNVYYELYGLKEDGKPSYRTRILGEMRMKDPNQPLLGFTLLGVLGILIYLALRFNWLGV